MNRLNRAMLCATIFVLLSGCSGYVDTIEKNKVMVKKISEEQTEEEASYGDLLSLETVSTLSINAVNKYFGQKLTGDDVQIDLRIVDQEDLRPLIESLEHGAAPQSEGDIPLDTDALLKEVPSGLFYVDLEDKTDSRIQYDLVLNARDGKVLQVKEQIDPRPRSEVVKEAQKSNPVVHTTDRGSKVMEIAVRFMMEKAGINLANSAFSEGTIRWDEDIVELFFKDEQNELLLYSVFVDLHTNAVVGFNRDLMAVLSFFS